LPLRDSDALHDALIARMSDLPAWLLRSITWDQGSEMAQHLASIHRRPGWGELISLWAAAPA
jgi:IS30 family transposase